MAAKKIEFPQGEAEQTVAKTATGETNALNQTAVEIAPIVAAQEGSTDAANTEGGTKPTDVVKKTALTKAVEKIVKVAEDPKTDLDIRAIAGDMVAEAEAAEYAEKWQPYFDQHPDETELFYVVNKNHDPQVFMGSQKPHAINFAKGDDRNIKTVKRR